MNLQSRNICCQVEYEGTDFSGFQRQGPGVRTVEGVLLDRLRLLAGHEINLSAASRTDAGVHARGQVISFHLASSIPTANIPRALNSMLPSDLVITEAREVDHSFQARFDACGKLYLYRILNSEYPSAFEARYALHLRYPLQLEKMQRAAKELVGRRDFSSFAVSSSRDRNPVCRLSLIEVEAEGELITLKFYGDRFLYQMVRIITGTLIEVGRERISPSELGAILRARDRNRAGPTVRPEGLFLVRVDLS